MALNKTALIILFFFFFVKSAFSQLQDESVPTDLFEALSLSSDYGNFMATAHNLIVVLVGTLQNATRKLRVVRVGLM